MSGRKQQILQSAIHIIAEEGYGALTMRALSRASDLKLGALQYHYPTRDDMLRALIEYITQEYQALYDMQTRGNESQGLYAVVSIILAGNGTDDGLTPDKLWPQLFAMRAAEPLMKDLLNRLYQVYLDILETALENAGSEAPRPEALCLMAMLEGVIDFIGRGRHWESDAGAVRDLILGSIEAKYGKS